MALNRELGLACRYGDLNEVKDLVKRGASFKYPDDSLNRSPARINSGNGFDFSLMLIDNFPLEVFDNFAEKERAISPITERLKIIEFLFVSAERVGLIPERLLYFSICYECDEIYGLLKKHGVSLPKDVKIRFVQQLNIDKRRSINSFRLSVAEIGLDYFDKFTKSKMKLLRYIIDNDAADMLAKFEALNWFKHPDRLQELISYAADNKKPQCAAWLLEYSNRTR